MNTTHIKLKALQEQFSAEYPFLKKHVWLEHFAGFFWFTRQVLYVADKKTDKKTKRHGIDERIKKNRNSKKFLQYLLSLKK